MSKFDQPPPPPELRGRAARRKDAKRFDVLAQKLLALPLDRFRGLPVSPDTRRVMNEARELSSHAARRRAARQVAGLLRNSEAEVEAIEAFLDGRSYTRVKGDQSVRELGEWRDRLCDPDAFELASDEAFEAFPELDLLLVRELSLELHGLDDKARGKHKAYKLLYKELCRASELVEDDD